MLPTVGIEPRPLMNLCFQFQHFPFLANWAFACKTETLGQLYSHALLISTKWSKSKNQVMHKQKFKDAHLSQKGECWTLNQRFMRGLGSIPAGG